MHVRVEYGLLARVLDLLIDLIPSLRVHFLDLGRMDAAVGHQFRERQSGDLPADRIEPGEHHRFGSVVDDEIYPGEILQGADVPALAPDDAALHVVRRQGHHRHGGIGHVAGSRALDTHREDILGPALAFVARLFLDGTHQLGHVVADFVLRPLEQELGSLILGQPGNLLQLALLLRPCGLRLFENLPVVSLPVGHRLLPAGHVLLQLV